MIGRVDDEGRALLSVTLRHPTKGDEATLDAWVDTGFNGYLVLPREPTASLGLPAGYIGRAVLADGSNVELKAYLGQIEWFGELMVVEVIANDGRFPLLGVGLLLGRELNINYSSGTVTLS